MKKLHTLKSVLIIIGIFGLVACIGRFAFGLGAATAVTDQIPWGQWKVLNMVAGAALGTCGFVMALIVVVLRFERFEPLLRPATLIAFLGYGSSCFALLLDIGLPWRIYHPFIFWNIHSFLFEVSICVTMYFTITAIEMIPIVTERGFLHKFHELGHKIHHYVVPIVIVGITLSSMHHTSLGALFIPSPERLHPIWYSPWLNWIFIISAMGAGMMTLIWVSLTVSGLYNRKPDLTLLQGVAFISIFFLCFYAAIKSVDLSARHVWPIIFNGQWEGIVFMIESFLFVLLPVAIIISPARRTFAGLLIASMSTLAGLIMNRLNVGIVGFFRSAGATYFPSIGELFIGLGVMAGAALLFFVIVENYDIYDKPPVLPKEV